MELFMEDWGECLLEKNPHKLERPMEGFVQGTDVWRLIAVSSKDNVSLTQSSFYDKSFTQM